MYINVKDRFLIRQVNDCCDNDKLPSDIKNWCEKTVFKTRRFMFFKTFKNFQLGYCQNCSCKDIKIKRSKTQLFLNCPNCHRKMKLRNIIYPNCYDFDYFNYVTKLDSNKFIIRTFKVFRNSDFLSFNYVFIELERHLFELDFENGLVVDDIYFRIYNNKWTLGFYNVMGRSIPDCIFVYNKNLNMFNHGLFKYLPLSHYCKYYAIDLFSFLKRFFGCRQLEYMLKLKMSNFINSMYNNYLDYVSFAFDDMKKFLRLNGKYYKYFINHNLYFSDLVIIRTLQKYQITPNINNLNLIRIILYDCDFLFKFFNFNSFKKYFNSVIKTKNRFSDYIDYLRNAIELNYDLSNTMYLKPKNLSVAHDNAYLKINSIKSPALYSKVRKVCNKYCKLNYVGDKYLIVMPKCADDIVLEGLNNHNCVETYLGKLVDGNCIICFCRKKEKPEASYYTVELDAKDFSVVQCRGYANKTYSEDECVLKFVKKWATTIKKRLQM